uniref:Uncharacterized protein n=1 Tax=Phlebotomus papatasi TaxID=29031 RepID=A0A1B0D8K4_PHLPP
MKYYSLLVFCVCVVAVYGQTYRGLGRIVPGQYILGFADNSTTVTSTPDSHSVTLSFQANPGIDITFVHINFFPDWSSMGYTPAGHINSFSLSVNMHGITHLGVNIIVYGVEARCVLRENSNETPKMVTVTNVHNSN